MPTHCLDACAIIAYLRSEPGAEILKALIERPNTFVPWVLLRSIQTITPGTACGLIPAYD
jgi:hypothetical protein